MKQREVHSYDSVYVTRYMGAKYKLIDLLAPAIERLAGSNGTVIDLMAGTHSVGYALKRQFRIIANDIQAYSQVFGEALLTNTTWSTVADRVEDDFRNLGGMTASPGWFTETYRDTYFSEYQCGEIEMIRSRIEEFSDRDLRSIYLLLLCSAMALCQSSPGHFAQYMPADHPRVSALRSMSVMAAFISRSRELVIDLTNHGNRVTRTDAFELVRSRDFVEFAGPGAVVYLDPPYTSAQYSRYYHLLETIVLSDEPEVSFKGLYRPDRYQSPFCSAVRVSKSFAEIFANCAQHGWPIVVSYSSHGLLKINELADLLQDAYPTVLINGKPFNHSMQGRGVVHDRTEFVLSGSW